MPNRHCLDSEEKANKLSMRFPDNCLIKEWGFPVILILTQIPAVEMGQRTPIFLVFVSCYFQRASGSDIIMFPMVFLVLSMYISAHSLYYSLCFPHRITNVSLWLTFNALGSIDYQCYLVLWALLGVFPQHRDKSSPWAPPCMCSITPSPHKSYSPKG